VSNGTSSRTQSDAEAALAALLPLAARFQERFAQAIRGRQTGSITLRISYDRGRVKDMAMDANEREHIQVRK